ncbi:hypothetical protein IAQ61_007485 [Plenodomus lingam]|uniref:Similar to acid phosphatase n=1 Tax=Leptosphaeria maculans (strain JN3 / isolate v23.1.3 / race Av1-4-5-6-7-8) TaxID=985895 RepID=E5A5K6_LEPMJ|nr:similar to acid phosphatase [Plenodomus lingam JN3]KAH9866896.1 hypothetical protein IAQ61_007485 [Plenodomus lingam]CBX98904.1 similar to acid phosphatase [Plenodomus lingam JN3]
MHILITNDDGPPSDQSSPYVHSLVTHLQSAGHTVSVILPHTQRSWIGKAHLVGKSVSPTYYRPQPLQTTSDGRLTNHGSTHDTPLPPDSKEEEWVLVDSTPASCVQIGLFHYFQERGPIDLVVSGPNYGRNSTAVFSLSSGTIGGAMEAAVCGAKSIALSYAFFDRNHDAQIISDASALSTRLIQHLWDHWDPSTHLYTVNVPLVEGVQRRKILYTDMLQNSWKSGSCFQVVETPAPTPAQPDPESTIRLQEANIAKLESAALHTSEDPASTTQPGSSSPAHDQQQTKQVHARYTHKSFKWAPLFKDVYESVEASEPGNDGWAVAQGYTSVTPLRANFMHVPGFTGEITLAEGRGESGMTAADAERQSDDR